MWWLSRRPPPPLLHSPPPLRCGGASVYILSWTQSTSPRPPAAPLPLPCTMPKILIWPDKNWIGVFFKYIFLFICICQWARQYQQIWGYDAKCPPLLQPARCSILDFTTHWSVCCSVVEQTWHTVHSEPLIAGSSTVNNISRSWSLLQFWCPSWELIFEPIKNVKNCFPVPIFICVIKQISGSSPREGRDRRRL